MRAAEEAAFARGISAEALMEQAGAGIARSIAKFFPRVGKCIVFAGKGHNSGDAFVAARWLAQAGWDVETRLIFPEKELSPLTSRKLGALRESQGERGLRAPIREDAAAIERKGPFHLARPSFSTGCSASVPIRRCGSRSAALVAKSIRSALMRGLSQSTSRLAWTVTRAKPMTTVWWRISRSRSVARRVGWSRIRRSTSLGGLRWYRSMSCARKKPKLVPNWRFRNRSATFCRAGNTPPTKTNLAGSASSRARAVLRARRSCAR